MIENVATKKTYIRAIAVMTILMLLTVLCYWNKSLQLSKAQKEITLLKRQKGEFKVTINNKNEVIATQEQNIVEMQTAIKELFDEKERWKTVKSVVRIETKIVYDTIIINYLDTIYDTDTIYPSGTITVPKRFSKTDEYYKISGLVLLDGIMIDSLIIPNDTRVVIGSKKEKWWKKAKPIVEVKNTNKYLTVQSMDNVVVEDKKKFYQKNSFWMLLGVTLGLSTLTLIN